jgi:hypothetical protein
LNLRTAKIFYFLILTFELPAASINKNPPPEFGRGLNSF